MKNLLLITSLLFSVISASSQKYELISLDGKLKADIEINSGINVTLNKDGITAVKLGNIYLETDNKLQNPELKVQRAFRSSVNEIVKPQIREKTETLINAYNELELRFKSGHSITFRLFNEGLAYRFSTSSKDSLTIFRENLDIFLEANDSARFQSSATFNSCWETPYEHSKIDRN